MLTALPSTREYGGNRLKRQMNLSAEYKQQARQSSASNAVCRIERKQPEAGGTEKGNGLRLLSCKGLNGGLRCTA